MESMIPDGMLTINQIQGLESNTASVRLLWKRARQILNCPDQEKKTNLEIAQAIMMSNVI